jgi:hypothetical protein
MEKQSLDLSAFDFEKAAETGFELVLRNAVTDEPLPGKIRLLGADSQTYKDKAKAILRPQLERLNRGRRMRRSLEDIEAEALELLVAATQGWSGMTLDGAEFPFSADNARWLYQNRKWIREQVDAAVGDRANFLPRSASS